MCAPGRRAITAAGQCQQLAGSCVDAHVTGLLLAAMAPAALEVSLAAAEQAEAQRAQVDRIWRQRLERAEFAADRARRQYQLAEPENRLVARQLEKDWETALAERQRLGEEYDRFTATRPRTLTAAEREQIRALAADLPAVWNAPTTTDADRKQLIRHLIEQVRITVLGTSEKADVEVTWAGGHRTAAQITRPVACLTQLSYYPQLAARARELADGGSTTAQIAQRLNAEGFRPPKRIPVFTPNAVSDLLRALGIQRSHIPARRNRPALAQHEWWLRDLAEHLGMSADHPRLLGPPRLGHRLPAPPGQAARGPRRPRRSRTAARPAPRAPGPAQPPPLAEKPGSTHEHRTGRSPQRCRPAAAMTALRLARLDLEQPVVSADHELRGHRRPVGAGGEVGDVALQPGQGPGLRLQLAVDALGAARSWTNRFRLTGALPATACSALATCSSMPRRVRRARSAR